MAFINCAIINFGTKKLHYYTFDLHFRLFPSTDQFFRLLITNIIQLSQINSFLMYLELGFDLQKLKRRNKFMRWVRSFLALPPVSLHHCCFLWWEFFLPYVCFSSSLIYILHIRVQSCVSADLFFFILWWEFNKWLLLAC